MDGPSQPGAGARVRLIFAGMLGCGLLAAVMAVALTQDGGPSPEPADPACVSAWNEDPAATTLGRHQFAVHRYQRAQVARLGSGAEPDPSGDCAVIFAASTLDAELAAAGQIQVGGQWSALSGQPGITPERLEQLQRDAAGLANARVGEGGQLDADD